MQTAAAGAMNASRRQARFVGVVPISTAVALVDVENVVARRLARWHAYETITPVKTADAVRVRGCILEAMWSRWAFVRPAREYRQAEGEGRVARLRHRLATSPRPVRKPPGPESPCASLSGERKYYLSNPSADANLKDARRCHQWALDS
jgi:hypothetical protein